MAENELTLDEKYLELAKKIPVGCNILKGFAVPNLNELSDETQTVTVNTPEGFVFLPPFFKIESIIEHYWGTIIESKATVVINVGTPKQKSYKRDDCGWIEDTSVKMQSQSRILTLNNL